jgi:glycosyltransferase involved in cell wall biosynthesis
VNVQVAVVIPALNAAATLGAVVAGVRRALPGVGVVAVDDGSSDRTRAVARASCDQVVAFDRNQGKGAALRAGFAAALARGASIVVTLDADGQHDPAHAPRLVQALRDADVALGARARDATMPLGRRMTNALSAAALSSMLGRRVADAQSGYRAFRRVVLERVRGGGDRYEYETDLLVRAYRAGFRVVTVPVPTLYGPPSHFRPLSDSMRIVRTIWRLHAEGPR